MDEIRERFKINMFMVSIIVPHFESYDKLERLLKSIGNYKDIQVIVVDDCSNRNVKSMFQPNYPFVEFYRTEKNGGAGLCRNIGLKHAMGKWLLFADADDYFLEGYYAKLKQYYESDYDIVYFAPTSIYEDTGEKADRHMLYEGLILNYLDMPMRKTENYLKYRYVSPWSKLIRNSLIQKNTVMFEEVKVSNDVMFSTRSGYFARTVTADKQVIYCATRDKGTLTTKRDFENMYIRLEEYIKSYLFLKERISCEELKELNWCGGAYWLLALQNRYSIKEWYLLTKLMVENHLPLWDKHFVSKSIRAMKDERKNRKYK